MVVTTTRPVSAITRLVDFLNSTYPERSREGFIQREVKRRIAPLLSLGSPKELLEFHLARLIADINRMGLRPHWVITQAEISKRSLRHGERVLRVQDTEWVLSKISLSEGVRESVYYDIVRALEDDDFGRLRRCRTCQRFFAAKDFRQDLCGTICKNARESETAKIRMARKRQRAKESARRIQEGRRLKLNNDKFQ